VEVSEETKTNVTTEKRRPNGARYLMTLNVELVSKKKSSAFRNSGGK